ncbi:MAG: hypothetical protein L0Y71_10200 [Gemmataceae bacterium]|nr:hypothetical protein [Gemmataceae bacterium]
MNPTHSDLLGPSLPIPVYHAMERWHPERIHAVALYCSDGRWGEAFDEFCHRHLQLPRYDRLALPGGPGWLAGSAEDAGGHVDFLVRAHELERVVLITHYGCAWYGQRLQRSPDECLAAQAEDVQAAATVLHDRFPELRVEAYLAMRRHDWVTFHRLELG